MIRAFVRSGIKFSFESCGAVKKQRHFSLASVVFCNGKPAKPVEDFQNSNKFSAEVNNEINPLVSSAEDNPHINPIVHWETLACGPPKTSARTKFLRVAILGVPNSGKSTLINKLVKSQVCPQSQRVNTTRHNARAILTEADTQIVFLDTPGVITEETAKKFKLENSLLLDPEKSCMDADLLLVIQDLSNRYVRESIDKSVLRLLCFYSRVPAILVLNKLDTIPRSRRIFDLIRKLTCNRVEGEEESQVKISKYDSKKSIEKYIRRKELASMKDSSEEAIPSEISDIEEVYKIAKKEKMTEMKVASLTKGLIGWPGFTDVFTISALNGDGVDDLREYLMDSAKSGPWIFPSNILTDEDPRKIVVDTVKSKILDHLDGYLAYPLQPQIEAWEIDPDWQILRLVVSVSSPNANTTKNLLRGGKGCKMARISKDAEQSLRNFFSKEIHLTVNLTYAYTSKVPREPITKKPDLFL